MRAFADQEWLCSKGCYIARDGNQSKSNGMRFVYCLYAWAERVSAKKCSMFQLDLPCSYP
jgi:hypothetical protein